MVTSVMAGNTIIMAKFDRNTVTNRWLSPAAAAPNFPAINGVYVYDQQLINWVMITYYYYNYSTSYNFYFGKRKLRDRVVLACRQYN